LLFAQALTHPLLFAQALIATDTVCVVNAVELHALLLGVPLALVAVLSVLIWSHKGTHPATYEMSEEWTHGPILWAAVDETVGSHGGHGTDEFTVGGGASGKW
jgi:hypothetical protein